MRINVGSDDPEIIAHMKLNISRVHASLMKFEMHVRGFEATVIELLCTNFQEIDFSEFHYALHGSEFPSTTKTGKSRSARTLYDTEQSCDNCLVLLDLDIPMTLSYRQKLIVS